LKGTIYEKSIFCFTLLYLTFLNAQICLAGKKVDESSRCKAVSAKRIIPSIDDLIRSKSSSDREQKLKQLCRVMCAVTSKPGLTPKEREEETRRLHDGIIPGKRQRKPW
jgi:hypothetical protein